MDVKGKTLAVIGLGYPGLQLAVEFGKRRAVIGFQVKNERVAEVPSGKDHTLDCLRAELKAATHARYTSGPEDVGHGQSQGRGDAGIKAFGRPGAVAYDVKSLLPLAAAHGRL